MQKPVERLKKKVQKENLWFFILSLLEKKKLYGREIRELIKKEFGFFSGNVTAYKVLYIMKRGGYVTRFIKDGRKYYKITPKGKKQLKDARKFLKEIYKKRSIS